MNPKAFIFFGRSGSGKGTQAKLLLEYLAKQYPDQESIYVETGAEFRKFMMKDGYTNSRVKDVLDDGNLLPEFLPIWIWTSVLIEKYTGNQNIVFDGISRRVKEAPIVDGALDFYGIQDRHVVYINVSREWSKEKLTGRGRYDDNVEEIDKRLNWYEENVAPVVEIFKNNKDYNFLDINGEQAIERVHQDIIDGIKE